MLNLKKSAAEQIIVEFHKETPEGVLTDFLNQLKKCKIPTKLSDLDYPFRINFYMIGSCESKQKTLLNKYCNEVVGQPTLSILYQNNAKSQQSLPEKPIIKTILLREALPKIIEFVYELHITQDQKESLDYLLDTTKLLIESESSEELSLFDQLTQNKSSRDANKPEKVWLNMLYQIPGIGFDKAETISQAYPTVEQLYRGINEGEISNLPVKRGDKVGKLGQAISEKLTRIFTSLSPDELV